jgi:hypothetical protein
MRVCIYVRAERGAESGGREISEGHRRVPDAGGAWQHVDYSGYLAQDTRRLQ